MRVCGGNWQTFVVGKSDTSTEAAPTQPTVELSRPPQVAPDFWRLYLTLSTVIFCGFVALGSAGPFQALYAVSRGATLGQVALLAGGYTSIALFAGLAWGRLADRPGRRKWLMVGGMCLLGIVHLASALVPHWEWLVPLRFIEGLAIPAHQVASMAMMGDLLAGHPNRPRLISAYRMSGSLAFSVAIVASGALSQAVGYAGSYFVATVFFAIGSATAATLPAVVHVDVSVPGTPPPRVGFGELLTGPMRPVLILALAFGLPFSMVYSVWPIWIANELGLGQATYSQLWGLAAFAEVPFMLAAGWMIGRAGAPRTFTLGLIAFSAVYCVYLINPPIEGLFLAQVVRGLGFAAYTATSLTMAIELAPATARGRAAGLYQSAQGLAQITGNWIGPPLAGAFGFRPIYALAAVAVLGGAAYALRIARPTPQTDL